MHKLAFGFLIVGDFNNPLAWQRYFSSADEGVLVLVHEKAGREVSRIFRRQCQVHPATECLRQKLLLGQQQLIRQAFALGADQLVILSDSCAPLCAFAHARSLLNTDKSIISCIDDKNVKETSLWRFSQCQSVKRLGLRIAKGSQWCILNRRLMKFLLENESLVNDFHSNVIYGEEHLYPMLVCAIPELQKSNINCTITNCDWSRTKGDGSPYTYTDQNLQPEEKGRLEDIQRSRQELFVRKFAPLSEENLEWLCSLQR